MISYLQFLVFVHLETIFKRPQAFVLATRYALKESRIPTGITETML